MHDQHRHGDFFQVFGEVGLRERDDAVVVRLGAADHALAPPVGDDSFSRLGARAVVAVERSARHIAIKLRAIRRQLRLKAIEHRFRQTARVAFGLHHQRWYGADQYRFADLVLTMSGNVMDHFAAAGGMADVDNVARAQMIDHRQHIVGVVIHVVAVPDLAGAAMPASIMSNHPKALREKEQHLRIPVIGTERPAVVEVDYRRVARAPVLVEDIDAVSSGDKAHIRYS